MRRSPPPYLLKEAAARSPVTLNIRLVPQGSLTLTTNSSQSQNAFSDFFFLFSCVSFASHLLTGILPTTALGRVQSPDLDDWSEKVYRFEGKPSRYFDLAG